MPPRHSLAKKKAESLLEQGNVRQAPVPVDRLARLLGLTIRFEPFPGRMSGFVRRTSPTGAIIGINSTEPAVRRRFTIAHEIGHFLLHDRELHVDEIRPMRFRDAKSATAEDDDEIEANQFASNLLMPARFLEPDLRDIGDIDVDDEATIKKLARRYEVSLQAMTLRLARFLDYGF